MRKNIILLAMLALPFGLYWAASLDSDAIVYLLLGFMAAVMAAALKYA